MSEDELWMSPLVPAKPRRAYLGRGDVTVLVDNVSDGSSLGVHLLFLVCGPLPHLGKVLVESDLLLQQVVGILLGLFLLGDLLLHQVDLFTDGLGIELHYEGRRRGMSCC